MNSYLRIYKLYFCTSHGSSNQNFDHLESCARGRQQRIVDRPLTLVIPLWFLNGFDQRRPHRQSKATIFSCQRFVVQNVVLTAANRNSSILQVRNMFMEYLLTGTVGAKFLWQLNRNQWRTSQELRIYQLKKLKAIVHHAYESVPYYHRLFKSVKFKPRDLRKLEDIRKIPITKKMDIQRNHLDFIVRGVDVSKCIEFYTSGSTGIPLKTWKDLRAASLDTAMKSYAIFACGARLMDKFVNVARRGRSLMLPNQILIPITDGMEAIIKNLKRIKPDIIYSNSNTLQDLCAHQVSGILPKLIFSRAVTLTDHVRNLVKHTFNIDINDTYGSTEFGRLAFECNEHSGLHMITDGALLEFLDDEGEWVADGEAGGIIGTGLLNYAMPIIRYDIGDIGVPTDERCGCGRNWPLINHIEGRTNDIFILPSGKKLYPTSIFTCIHSEVKENLFCISQFQIIQERRNKVTFKIVKGNEFREDVVNRIKQNLETCFIHLNEDVVVDIEYVKDISVDRAYKRKSIFSLVN